MLSQRTLLYIIDDDHLLCLTITNSSHVLEGHLETSHGLNVAHWPGFAEG